ncbi:MAG: hypothetical protein MI867_30530 [Pseudomonadales bacterium]|nr:hypothetical protein [Pseudomonadales bacterium]
MSDLLITELLDSLKETENSLRIYSMNARHIAAINRCNYLISESIYSHSVEIKFVSHNGMDESPRNFREISELKEMHKQCESSYSNHSNYLAQCDKLIDAHNLLIKNVMSILSGPESDLDLRRASVGLEHWFTSLHAALDLQHQVATESRCLFEKIHKLSESYSKVLIPPYSDRFDSELKQILKNLWAELRENVD